MFKIVDVQKIVDVREDCGCTWRLWIFVKIVDVREDCGRS